MSFTPWITVPVKDVHIDLPLSMQDHDIRIMFRNVETVDKTIEQLQNLRELLKEKTGGLV